MTISVRHNSSGLPLGKMNYIMAALALVISLLLIYATYRIFGGYEAANAATENYIAWEHSASSFKDATDYLTEQTRNFVMTGEKKYIQNYFMEINVTRRREAAMAELKDTRSYEKLEDAVKQSQDLVALERYAMRLAVSVYGYDLSEFPADIQSITLLSRDAKLPLEGKHERAKQLLLNSEYLEKKEAIDEDLRIYLTDLEAETRGYRTETMHWIRSLLEMQRLLVIALIALFALVILMNSFLIITPLMKGILNIQAEQPIPISGSYEFQYLANTYNVMFEANQKKTSDLAYSASHDKLTGLYNRVGYDRLLKNTEEMSTSALLLIDVDKFKSVNDTYGHDMGDRVLANIAHVLKDSFRSHDHVCRIGGDEFATIMTGCGPELEELIRGKVQRMNDKLLHPTDDLPPISVSVGVAFGSEQHGTGNIVKDADLALYQVKEHGRCGVDFFVPALLATAAAAAELPEA